MVNIENTLGNRFAYIRLKHIIIVLLITYVFWLLNVFYSSIVEIDKMYSDSYDKILDEKQTIDELIKAKNIQEDDYEFKIWINEIIWN